MSDPDWNSPAKLVGLPYKHWKRRTGYAETGTLTQMVERWLRLPWDHCSLGWGPDAQGRRGSLSGTGIGSYVLRHGLPPKMAAARMRPATAAEIEAMFAKPVLREGPPQRPGHSVP